jgi:hypothetical protein
MATHSRVGTLSTWAPIMRNHSACVEYKHSTFLLSYDDLVLDGCSLGLRGMGEAVLAGHGTREEFVTQ